MRMFPYSPINYSVAEPYDVRCTFDEEHHEWIYVFSMPEKDKAVLEEICKAYNIKAEDLIRQFYLWVIREPEAGGTEKKGPGGRFIKIGREKDEAYWNNTAGNAAVGAEKVPGR